MNNEEKILSILETMQGNIETMQGDIKAIKGRLDGIDERFAGVDKRFDGIDERFGGIDERFDGIDERLDALESEHAEIASAVRRIDKSVILIENEHGRKIGALFDGYQAGLDRDKAIEPRVTQLERTAERHSLEILTLKQAR